MALRASHQPSHPLRDFSFFAEMPYALVAEIESLVYHREYSPRQIVYFPEDACEHVFFVRGGRIKITRVSQNKREVAFRHELPGGLIGEGVLHGQTRWQDYAEAMETSLLCLMHVTDFRRFVQEEATFASAVAKHLSGRVSALEDRLAHLIFLPAANRVALELLRLAERQAPGETVVEVRVTHQELANLSGATRETTSHVLRQLRDSGVIEVGNRCLRVMNPGALRAHLYPPSPR